MLHLNEIDCFYRENGLITFELKIYPKNGRFLDCECFENTNMYQGCNMVIIHNCVRIGDEDDHYKFVWNLIHSFIMWVEIWWNINPKYIRCISRYEFSHSDHTSCVEVVVQLLGNELQLPSFAILLRTFSLQSQKAVLGILLLSIQ